MAGCGIPEFRPTPELAALAAKTREIESVQLTEQSKSPPVSIEEATKELTNEVTEPNQPRPMVKLSLPQVRAAALANNLGLKVELVEPSLAQQVVDVERARFESVFRASASYSRTERQEGDARSFGAFEPSVETPLQTGGSVITRLPVTEDDGVSEAAASVSVVQSLLRDAGTQVNTYALQIAGYNKGSVDALTKLQAINILTNADITYWNLYAARIQLAVNREQYKLAENQVRIARVKVAAGSAAKIEIVRAEAGLSGSLDGVIGAETAVRDCGAEPQADHEPAGAAAEFAGGHQHGQQSGPKGTGSGSGGPGSGGAGEPHGDGQSGVPVGHPRSGHRAGEEQSAAAAGPGVQLHRRQSKRGTSAVLLRTSSASPRKIIGSACRRPSRWAIGPPKPSIGGPGWRKSKPS